MSMITAPLRISGLLIVAYDSFKALRNNSRKEQKELLSCWFLLAFLHVVEPLADYGIAGIIPFYGFFKGILALWLLMPHRQGASFVFKLLLPLLERYEQKCATYVDRYRTALCSRCSAIVRHLAVFIVQGTVSSWTDKELEAWLDSNAVIARTIKAENTKRLSCSVDEIFTSVEQPSVKRSKLMASVRQKSFDREDAERENRSHWLNQYGTLPVRSMNDRPLKYVQSTDLGVEEDIVIGSLAPSRRSQRRKLLRK